MESLFCVLAYCCLCGYDGGMLATDTVCSIECVTGENDSQETRGEYLRLMFFRLRQLPMPCRRPVLLFYPKSSCFCLNQKIMSCSSSAFQSFLIICIILAAHVCIYNEQNLLCDDIRVPDTVCLASRFYGIIGIFCVTLLTCVMCEQDFVLMLCWSG